MADKPETPDQGLTGPPGPAQSAAAAPSGQYGEVLHFQDTFDKNALKYQDSYATTTPSPDESLSTSATNDSSSSSASPSPSEESESSDDYLEKADGIKLSENFIAGLRSDAITPNNDEAGYHIIARAIAGVLKNPELKPPYNVGVIGNYGSGKSKIVKQMISALTGKDNKSIPVKVVEFDVGRYHDSKFIWSALIYTFFEEYKKEFRWTASFRYFWTLSNWERIKSIAPVFFAIAATFLLLFWYSIPWINKIAFAFQSLPNIISLIPLYFLIKNIRSIWFHPIVKGSIDNIASMPLNIVKEFSDRIAFEKKLLRLFLAWIKENERIVLVVDNLDRCCLKNITGIIDELYALISAKEIEQKLMCVIAVDLDAINEAIRKQRHLKAHDYFEKLFSLKIFPPHLRNGRLRDFLADEINIKNEKTSTASNPEIDFTYDDYRLKDDEKEMIYDKLNNYPDGHNPRKIKRVISSYQFLKYIWPRWFSAADDFSPEKLIEAIVLNLVENKLVSEEPYSEAAALIAGVVK